MTTRFSMGWRAAVLVWSAAVVMTVGLAAQAPPKGPTVTVTPDDSKAVVQTSAPLPVVSELDRTKVQLALVTMENAQLKAQVAQQAFEAARAQLAALVRSLQRDGYDLDLQTLTYTKRPDPAKKDEGPTKK